MKLISPDQSLVPQAPRPAAGQEDDIFGVNMALRMVARRFFLMAAVGGVVGLIVLTNLMSATPRFMATALIAINTRPEQVLDSSNSLIGELPRDAAAVDSEIEVMRSPALMGELVDALSLTERAEWNWRLAEPPAWREFIASLMPPSRDPSEELAQTKSAEEIAADTRRSVANAVTDSILVRRRGVTYVIEISGVSQDPVMAQQLANTYADIYLESQSEARVAQALRATSWLDSRIEERRVDVQRKEAAVEEFRVETGIMSAGGGSLIEQQVTNVQTSVLQARADLAEKQARFRQVRDVQRDGGSLDTIGDVINSSLIPNLRSREAEVAQRQSDLEARYFETHPEVQAVRAEREDIARQIDLEVDRILANLGNEVEIAESRLASLQEQLDEVTAELREEASHNVRLRELEREATASRDVYENLLQRQQEVMDQQTLNAPDARLVSYASGPGWKIAPNLRVALALAVFAGGFVGLGSGVLAEVLDRSIRSVDDIENKLGYPTIATIPTIRRSALRSVVRSARNPAGYLVKKPMSAFAEALRVLRTVIVHSNVASASPVVAVASAMPGEGKTTVALSLARVAALSGQRVVVVDCDLRKQSISEFMEDKPTIGLTQVLEGHVTWQDAIHRDGPTQADILPAAVDSFSPVDIFGGGAMESLLAELRETYDLVVLDCPPVFAVAEARVLGALADMVVMVAQLGRSTVDAVRVAIDHIVSSGGRVEGVALNRVPTEGLARFTGATPNYSYALRSYYNVQ